MLEAIEMRCPCGHEMMYSADCMVVPKGKVWEAKTQVSCRSVNIEGFQKGFDRCSASREQLPATNWLTGRNETQVPKDPAKKSKTLGLELGPKS